jgi:hypothetical protein
MPLNLVKLCVGVDSIADLEERVKLRLKQAAARGEPRRHIHVTRMTPKRDAEILDGGSIYWVIKGEIACREKIVALEPFRDKDGISRCRIVMEPKIIRVEPRPMRAFQGWRYYPAKDAPADTAKNGQGTASLPEALRKELRELGLL